MIYANNISRWVNKEKEIKCDDFIDINKFINKTMELINMIYEDCKLLVLKKRFPEHKNWSVIDKRIKEFIQLKLEEIFDYIYKSYELFPLANDLNDVENALCKYNKINEYEKPGKRNVTDDDKLFVISIRGTINKPKLTIFYHEAQNKYNHEDFNLSDFDKSNVFNFIDSYLCQNNVLKTSANIDFNNSFEDEYIMPSSSELKGLLNEFLYRWKMNNIENMSLQQYVSIGDKHTFCQWVETKTRILGSIKGMTSIKFGIYERKDPDKKPKNYENDNKYSWLHAYGKNNKEAFKNIKKDIIDIITLSETGQFEKIDEIILPELFKWKVAFLYSNERLIPIYKREVLFKIAKYYGMKTNSQTRISEIQELMISNKPSNKSVFIFMRELFNRFGKVEDNNNISIQSRKDNKRKRKGTTNKNIQTVTRTINSSYEIEPKHDKIQEALRKHLAEKYGEENIKLEENYVDVKLIQPDYLGFYEVKSSSYASECIKEALGQILLYSYLDQDKRKKKIFIVGQYPANENDYGYINYIKDKLKLEFEYINVDIN